MALRKNIDSAYACWSTGGMVEITLKDIALLSIGFGLSLVAALVYQLAVWGFGRLRHRLSKRNKAQLERLVRLVKFHHDNPQLHLTWLVFFCWATLLLLIIGLSLGALVLGILFYSSITQTPIPIQMVVIFAVCGIYSVVMIMFSCQLSWRTSKRWLHVSCFERFIENARKQAPDVVDAVLTETATENAVVEAKA